MRLVALAAACALGLALLTSCGERAEPTGKTVPLYPVTLEQPGSATIVLDDRPQNVVARTETAAALVSAVAGRQISPTPTTAGADLVVTTADAETGSTSGPPTYTARADSIDQVERTFSDLGLLLGRPLLARTLDSRIQAKRELVRNRLSGVKPVTVFVDTGFFITPPAESLVGDLVREAGGTSVAGAHPPAGPFDARKLRRLDPDYYLATSDSGVTLHDLRHDPRTRHLRAVRLHHVVTVPSNLLRAGPQIGSGLLAVARVLHPDAFH